MMPATSTISEKQDFAALSTVTAAPLGALASAGCSAARVGSEARASRPPRSRVGRVRDGREVGGGVIGVPVRLLVVIDIRRLVGEPSGKGDRGSDSRSIGYERRLLT